MIVHFRFVTFFLSLNFSPIPPTFYLSSPSKLMIVTIIVYVRELARTHTNSKDSSIEIKSETYKHSTWLITLYKHFNFLPFKLITVRSRCNWQGKKEVKKTKQTHQNKYFFYFIYCYKFTGEHPNKKIFCEFIF